jgi:hypothetical protein
MATQSIQSGAARRPKLLTAHTRRAVEGCGVWQAGQQITTYNAIACGRRFECLPMTAQLPRKSAKSVAKNGRAQVLARAGPLYFCG